MMSEKLPAVLQGTKGNSSISTRRALNQIKGLLESYPFDESDESLIDRLNASIDDVEVMLSAVE
jgi:hypothetical protein